MMIALATLALALLLELTVGEPPARIHPVCWMGHLARRLLAEAPGRPAAQLVFGAAVALFVPALFALPAYLLLAALPAWAQILVGAYLLKASFAVRALGDAARGVRDALRREDLDAARLGLRSLCSRDASTLGPADLSAATVESVAENSSDSIVAPLCYFVLLGPAGALAYRAVNTLDAMIGYRGKYEWLGKAAARLDDLANLVPARLTALLLLVAGWMSGADAREGLRAWWRDARATESPNAGRPMATMAGLLRVELVKHGHYRLGRAHRPVDAGSIDAAWGIVRRAAALAFLLAAGVLCVGY